MSRMPQVNSMIQKTLGEIISKNIETPFDFMITVSNVKCGSDLKFATVFISVLPFDKANEAIKFLIDNHHAIRGFLGRSIRLKYTPKLNFRIDDREQVADSIYAELDNLK